MAARRLLKSHLRMQIVTALAEESERWAAAVEVEKGIEQQAREGWKNARPSWGFDDLAKIVEDALREAVEDVKETFDTIREDSWVQEQIDRYVRSFNFLDFLAEASREV